MLDFIKRITVSNICVRAILSRECDKLKLPVIPKLILGQAYPDKYGSRKKNRIFINISVHGLHDWVQTLRHELRHEWQSLHYNDIVEWCVSKPEYYKFGRFYELCPVELDAEYYVRTKGAILDGPISYYTVSELEEMYQDGSLIEHLARLAWWYGFDY